MNRKRISAFVLAAALLVTSLQVSSKTVYATPSEAKLNEVKSEINALLSEQGAVEHQISEVQLQVAAMMAQIDQLVMEMDVQAGEVEAAQIELDDSIALQEKQYADMKVRIRYMYENSNDSVFSIFLESKSFSDMLNRIRYMQDVYKYDRELLTAYEENTKHIESVKAQLEYELEQMQVLEADYEQQKADLEAYQYQLTLTAQDYAEQIEAAEALAAQYERQVAAEKAEEERKRREEEARRAAANGTGGTYTPSTSGGGGSTVNGYYAQADSLHDGSNPGYATSVSGSSIVAYARQFLGNPYVWGGTDLVNGTDCSGFTQGVLRSFGISINRTAAMQARQGQAVSYEFAQPGDLVFYAYSSGYVFHVGIYEGNGMIIHASSPSTGIIESSANYNTIYCIKRMH